MELLYQLDGLMHEGERHDVSLLVEFDYHPRTDPDGTDRVDVLGVEIERAMQVRPRRQLFGSEESNLFQSLCAELLVNRKLRAAVFTRCLTYAHDLAVDRAHP